MQQRYIVTICHLFAECQAHPLRWLHSSSSTSRGNLVHHRPSIQHAGCGATQLQGQELSFFAIDWWNIATCCASFRHMDRDWSVDPWIFHVPWGVVILSLKQKQNIMKGTNRNGQHQLHASVACKSCVCVFPHGSPMLRLHKDQW